MYHPGYVGGYTRLYTTLYTLGIPRWDTPHTPWVYLGGIHPLRIVPYYHGGYTPLRTVLFYHHARYTPLRIVSPSHPGLFWSTTRRRVLLFLPFLRSTTRRRVLPFSLFSGTTRRRVLPVLHVRRGNNEARSILHLWEKWEDEAQTVPRSSPVLSVLGLF